MNPLKLISRAAAVVFLFFSMYSEAEVPFSSYIRHREIPLVQFNPGSGFSVLSSISGLSTKLFPDSAFGTHSLRITPTEKDGSLRIECTAGIPDISDPGTFLSGISAVVSVSGKKPVLFSADFTFENGSRVSYRNLKAYPGRWRSIQHKDGPLARPSSMILQIHGLPESDLLLDSIFLEITEFDLKKFHETLDFQTGVWKESLKDSSIRDLRETMEILVRLNSVPSAMILASVLDQKRSGLIAFPFLKRLSPVLKEYVAEKGLQSGKPGNSYISAALLQGCTEWKAVKFLQNMKNKQPDVEEFALQQLCAVSSPPLLETYHSLLKHTSPAVRISALQALGRIRSSTSIEQIAPLISDPLASLEAVKALGAIAKPGVIPILLKAAENPLLAASASQYLDTFDLREYIEQIGLLAESGHEEVRKGAANLLKAVIDTVPGPARLMLGRLLTDSSPLVRAQAAQSFSYSSSADSLPYLHEALNDSSSRAAVAVIRALGRIGKYNSLPHLVTHRTKGNPLTFYAVEEEIRKMHGQQQNLSPSAIDSFLLPASEKEVFIDDRKEVILFRRPIGRPVVSDPEPAVGEILKDSSLAAFILPGYVEPVTLSIYSPASTGEKRVTATDFRSQNGNTIPGSEIDIYIENESRTTRFLEHSSLLPRMDKGTSRRIWFFLKTDSSHPPASYSGNIRIGESIKLNTVFHVLPWGSRSVENYSFTVSLFPPETELERKIIRNNFPKCFYTVSEPFNLDKDGNPVLPHTEHFLKTSPVPAVLDLSPIACSGPRGASYAYQFHVQPVHSQRMLKTVLHFRKYSLDNSLPLPLYMTSADPLTEDTEETRISRELLHYISTVTGCRSLAFSSKTDQLPESNYIIQTSGDLDLKQREQTRLKNREIIQYTSPGSSLADIRKRAGLFQWAAESQGCVFGYDRTRGIPEGMTDAIPLDLIMASEGIKDLEYLIILQQIIDRSKYTETNSQRIKMMLEIEHQLQTLKNGLMPGYSSPVWQQVDIDVVRTFLMRSSLLVFLGIEL